MNLRKAIFWLHLIAGATAGVVILMMSVTGVLLAFERSITTWADGYRCAPPQHDAARLSMETLLDKVRETQSNAIPSTITLRSDPGAPVAFGFGREKTVFIDPYTGTVLGEGSRNVRAFFRLTTGLHRWLGTNENGRAAGRAVTGACNLAFLFLVVSGIYLWWPRNWGWTQLKAITLFNRTLRGKARDWNWHNVIGFWCSIPLFFIVLSGVIMSYPWANNLLYRLTGNEPPPARAESGRNSGKAESQRSGGEGQRNSGSPRNREAGMRRGERSVQDNGLSSGLKFDNLSKLYSSAEQQISGWQTITLRMPSSAVEPFAFSIDLGDGGRPDRRTQLTLDAQTCAVVKLETFESYNLGRRLRFWARFVHTGEAGGFVGQSIAALVSAGGGVLVWTGLALAWRRFFRRANERKGQTLPVVKDVSSV